MSQISGNGTSYCRAIFSKSLSLIHDNFQSTQAFVLFWLNINYISSGTQEYSESCRIVQFQKMSIPPPPIEGFFRLNPQIQLEIPV